MTSMTAIILAAGKGTRMVSAKPKVLHQLMGKSMLAYVLDAVEQSGMMQPIVVVGNGAEEVKSTFDAKCLYAVQEPQLGTGHGVMQALPYLAEQCSSVMILCGDTPLLTAETLLSLKNHFLQTHAACVVMTAYLEHPGSYGRIIRNTAGDVQKIVEARDADEYELAISEVNSGVYCFDRNALQQIIGEIKTNNDQEEYYLTDAVAALREQGEKVSAFVCADQQQISGVNDRSQLAEAARVLQLRKNRQLMLSGVTIVDPQTTYIDSMVTVGLDTVIEPQSYICGNSRIGTNCQIGPMVKIVDSLVGDGGVIGPFAYLRPGTKLGARVKAGHFVEIKNSVVGDGSKVPHLSYIGDAEIGQNVNIGCGVITCNYDGVDKHKTEIGDGAFIGSNSNFIAPVKVGSNCTVAAGSTLTANVPDDALAIARAYQCNIENWAGKNKNSKK